MKKLSIVLCLIISGLVGISQDVRPYDLDQSIAKKNLIDKREVLKGKKLEGGTVFSVKNQQMINNKLTSSFTVIIDAPGDYYLTSYVLGINNVPMDNNEVIKKDAIPLQKVGVYVDNLFLGNLDIAINGWQSSNIKGNKKVFLSEGEHTIIFEADLPYYPEIDAVKLSLDANDAKFDMSVYNKYIDELKFNGEKNKDRKEKLPQQDFTHQQPVLKSASNSTSDWQVTPYQLSNPLGNYQHTMNVPVVYTYYKKIYLNSGQHVTYTAGPKIPLSLYSIDPVMYLFCEDNFQVAWANDDYSGLQPRIDVTIPQSGNYYLVLRAYSNSYASSQQGSQGVVDVFQNGSLLQENAPVSGFMTSVGTSNTGILNYFTGYSTGTPKLWLAPNGNTQPIQFQGSTYWYSPPMDYNWFDDARFRIVKNTSNYMDMYLLISSEGAWWVYWGNCDLYGSCMQATSQVLGYFPNLKANDAIQSAPSTNIYNCAAWAGGLTNGWFWGCLHPDQGTINCSDLIYGSAYVWSTWDNYFGNNPSRYAGAVTYTKDQANSSNGDVAVWSTDGTIAEVTHFSVRREGNSNPHGYDWESKPGTLERVFHPRDAMSSTDYGSIFAYYRDASKSPDLGLKSASIKKSKVFTFDESVANGLTVIQNILLSDNEKKIIENLKSKKSILTIDDLYNNWIAKCKSPEFQINSNPLLFFENLECRKLEEFWKDNIDLSLAYFSDKVFKLDESSFECQITSMLFCRLANKKYGQLMEDVKKEWGKSNYDEKGAYIAPLATSNTKNYIKRILEDKSGLKSATLSDSGKNQRVILDNHEFFMVYPNPIQDESKIFFMLNSSAIVSLSLCNSNGSLVRSYLSNKTLNGGRFEFKINADGLTSGIYLCNLLVDKTSLTRKVLVK